jgi:hypothetical protein
VWKQEQLVSAFSRIPRCYRAKAPAANPGAEAAFKMRADEIVQEQHKIASIQAERNEEGQ